MSWSGLAVSLLLDATNAPDSVQEHYNLPGYPLSDT